MQARPRRSRSTCADSKFLRRLYLLSPHFYRETGQDAPDWSRHTKKSFDLTTINRYEGKEEQECRKYAGCPRGSSEVAGSKIRVELLCATPPNLSDTPCSRHAVIIRTRIRLYSDHTFNSVETDTRRAELMPTKTIASGTRQSSEISFRAARPGFPPKRRFVGGLT